jgi:head-tail adaptor
MAIGQDRHHVTLEQPGPPVPDGFGGYTEGWTPLDPPTWDCAIQPATAADMERAMVGAPQATASHLVSGRYHPGITTETRILHEGRYLVVQSVRNLDERKMRLQLVCAEII